MADITDRTFVSLIGLLAARGNVLPVTFSARWFWCTWWGEVTERDPDPGHLGQAFSIASMLLGDARHEHLRPPIVSTAAAVLSRPASGRIVSISLV